MFSFSGNHPFTIHLLVPGHLCTALGSSPSAPLPTDRTSNMFINEEKANHLDKEHVGDWIRDGNRKRKRVYFRCLSFSPRAPVNFI